MQGAKHKFDNFAGYDKLLGGMIGDASPPQKLLGGMHPPHPPRDLRPCNKVYIMVDIESKDLDELSDRMRKKSGLIEIYD